MKKICIIEDDQGILNSLKLYLENSDFWVVTFESWDGASEFIGKENPNLVILDINLPVIDGIEVCKQVRIKSDVPIIMLTARGWEWDRIDGLESGADDYIAKPFSPRELLARINSILRRSNEKKQEELSESPHILKFNDIEIDTQKNEVRVLGEVISLTKNEYDILVKIVSAQWNMISRDVLMKEVIWYENYMYDRTIDTHIKNLRKKLGSKDTIVTIRGKWYRLNI